MRFMKVGDRMAQTKVYATSERTDQVYGTLCDLPVRAISVPLFCALNGRRSSSD
jgi:hypothetical protein